MPNSPPDEARAAIAAAGILPDHEIDLAAVALQFARIDQPEADWRLAAEALSALTREVVEVALANPVAAAGDLAQRALTLSAVIHDQGGFEGDAENYDDPANANLIRVLERKRGLPVALGILWLHVAEAAGWGAHGVDFPGHFLVALEGGRNQMVLDVFHGGLPLGAPELRQLIKQVEGEKAELRPGLLVAMDKRAVLLRLQNNIKLRRLRAGNLPGALACTEDMLRLAPGHAVLWREAGLMNQRLGRITAALSCLERCLELDPDSSMARRVRQEVEELRQRLH
jgi:regulator of sirC expression with transglutaminase-like and TPR domain